MKRTPIFNAIISALQPILQANGGPFMSFSTKWVNIAEFPRENCPVAILDASDELPKLSGNAPTVWTTDLSLLVYAYLPSSDTVGRAAVLNPLLDALDAALAPNSPAGVNTLGGLVDRISISGKIEKFGGITDDQIIAVVPLQYVAPQ
ncbi:MAG: hypothetical protein ACREJM_01765 [Candidatus Saccharimonadales bacterium]